MSFAQWRLWPKHQWMLTVMSLRDVNSKERDAAECNPVSHTEYQWRYVMSNSNKVPLSDLDLGSAKPIAVPMETIEVEISSENLLGDYARAFIAEAERVNPRLSQQVNLTANELESYAKFLLHRRVQCVKDECSDFRKLKVLYIPVWIQYNLSMIGEVVVRDKGLRLLPVIDNDVITLDEAIAISDRIGQFVDDLQIVQDAMPRTYKGDRDVMTTALIAGYVRSIDKVEHVASTYVTAFLGMKLREEAAFKVLYRVQYDDLQFIATALTRQKGLY